MGKDRDFLYPAVSVADATWRQVGNWRTEAALLAGGVSVAPILALTASLTTRVELFRDVVQLSSIAIASVEKDLGSFFKAIRGWTQFLVIDFSFIPVATIRALTDVIQFAVCLLAFFLLRRAMKKDPNAERDGLETTTFEQHGKLAVKWRYTLALILNSLYLPASAGALRSFVSLNTQSSGTDQMSASSGPDSTDGGSPLSMISLLLSSVVLLVVVIGFPITLYYIIRSAVPPAVKFDADGKPVEEDDVMFAQAVSKSRNPYTFILSDLRRHAAFLPVYVMVNKFALCLLTIAIIPATSNSGVWVSHTVFILLCIGSVAVFHRLQPYHDEMANHVVTINQAIVSANAIVAGLTAANVWGGGAAGAFILILQVAAVAVNSFNSVWRSEAVRSKLRNAFGIARFSRNDDGECMVLDPATDFVGEVHKRLWQPALDRLFYYGEGLALPKVASVNEQVIKYEQGLYDAAEDKQARRDTKGGGDGDLEAGSDAEHDEEDSEVADAGSSAYEGGMDHENEDADEPAENSASPRDASKKGQSILDKAAEILFRRKRRSDDPLATCGILTVQGCPPYLQAFRGTVGERHYENQKILEGIGEDRYAAELRRLSGGMSAEEQQLSHVVWTQLSAVDMYWQAPGAGRKGTGFGKAIVLPFPMCILFQFDNGSNEVMQPSALAHYVAGNRDAEIQRRRDVRLQLRCLQGELCYFHHQEWKSKTKSRQVTEWVHENGQQVQKTRTEYYSVTVHFTFENGRLNIGTLSKRAMWRGVNVAAGFNVTLYYCDGRGVDNEGTAWSGESTTVGHSTLGITSEFAMTSDLNRLLSKSMGIIRRDRPGVENFWANYRQHYCNVAEHKKRTLSYDSLPRVFKDRSLMRSDARDRLADRLRAEPNDAVASVPDRFDAFLTDLYAAASGVLVAGKRSAAWFTFWHDFWTMNCDLPRVRKQAELLNPLYRTSIAATYTAYANDRGKLEQTLRDAKLRSAHGNRGFFRASVLDILWQAMDRADEDDGIAGVGAGVGDSVSHSTHAQSDEEVKGEEPALSATPEQRVPDVPTSYGAIEPGKAPVQPDHPPTTPHEGTKGESARLIPS